MKIILSTIGRFHMFALARQIHAGGMLSQIYSGFNWNSLKREQLPRNLVTTFPLIRPAMMLWGRSGISTNGHAWALAHQASVVTFDRFVASQIEDCDLFVGHEASGLLTGRRAQRLGAQYVCDRGCSHIAYREAIIEEEYERCGLNRKRIRPRTYERELLEYDESNFIVVPSTFARSTFVKMGVEPRRLIIVPYGVELSVFDVENNRPRDRFDVVFCGGLSLRKGARDLFTAFNRFECNNKRLILAGSIDNDVRSHFAGYLAQDDVLEVGHLPHDRLRVLLARAHALVLPSIEDGFGMVLAEALACGCPIIATNHTGAPDLITDGCEGFIVPIRSPEEIAYKLGLLLDHDTHTAMSDAARHRVKSLGGWQHYGSRMIENFRRIVGEKEGRC